MGDGPHNDYKWRLYNNNNGKLSQKLVVNYFGLEFEYKVIKIEDNLEDFFKAEWIYILKPQSLKKENGQKGTEDFIPEVIAALSKHKGFVEVENGIVEGYNNKNKWMRIKTDSIDEKKIKHRLVTKINFNSD